VITQKIKSAPNPADKRFIRVLFETQGGQNRVSGVARHLRTLASQKRRQKPIRISIIDVLLVERAAGTPIRLKAEAGCREGTADICLQGASVCRIR